MTLTPIEIQDLAAYRYQSFAPLRANWDTMAGIFNNQHRNLFPDEYPADRLPLIAGFAKRSWQMYVRLCSKNPSLYVSPLKETKGARDAQERTEKILYGYNDIWDLERRLDVFYTYRIGMGAAGVGVIPDPTNKFPKLLTEDPRNCLPSPSWVASSVTTPGFLGMDVTQWSATRDAGAGTLDDMIIRKSMTGRQIRNLAQAGGYWSEALARAIPDSTLELERPRSVLQYYDDTNCVSVLNGYAIPLWTAPHGAPWCPWWFPCSFAPDIAAGDTDYIGQVGLEVAFGTLLNQKLALNDAVIWPWMVQSGQFETYPERRLMVASSPDAKANILSPPPQFQVDKDMGMLRDLMRLLNLETEATQGTMPGGPITGQGISNMNQASVVEKVQAYFRETGWWLSRLYATALIEDRNVFPDVEKPISAWAKGETFFTSYTPGKDIGPELGRIRPNFGPGLGGYQGHVAMLQDYGAESISKRTLMEHNENIPSVSNEERRLFLEAMDKLFMAGLAGQAAVPMDWIARCRVAVGDGADPMEWVTANPPGQNQATPGNVPPVPPEVAAAAAQGAGQAGAGPLGQAAPPPMAWPGGIGPGPSMWHPPPMRNLVGR